MNPNIRFEKTCVILGGAGFIGGHLAKKLAEEDKALVVIVDKERPSWHDLSKFKMFHVDLRSSQEVANLGAMLADNLPQIDEIYQLAADMGGVGYTTSHEIESLIENSKINANSLKLASMLKPKKYFFSSSVCVYPDMDVKDTVIREVQAYPAMPDLEYGWEKLYAERMVGVYAKQYPMIDFKIGRFENCFGENCDYVGGKEKAPAALARKVAMAKDGDAIEVWGTGTQTRSFIYVKDLVEAIGCLMDSNENNPVNIGIDEVITVNQLAQTLIEISGKKLTIKNIPGTEGVRARNFSHARIKELEFNSAFALKEGLQEMYNWIDAIINKK